MTNPVVPHRIENGICQNVDKCISCYHPIIEQGIQVPFSSKVTLISVELEMFAIVDHRQFAGRKISQTTLLTKFWSKLVAVGQSGIKDVWIWIGLPWLRCRKYFRMSRYSLKFLAHEYLLYNVLKLADLARSVWTLQTWSTDLMDPL